MSAPIILHVGLVKAASTKLQRSLFANHPEINYLGKPLSPELFQVMDHACWADVEEYDESYLDRYHKENIRPLFDNRNKKPLLSFEIITQMERASRTMVAHRLRRLLGECQVLVVLRSQPSWLESYYLWEYGKGNLKGSYEDFLFQQWRGPHGAGGIARHLNYASLISSFDQAFGKENVGVFLFEELNSDAEKFARDLCRYMEIDESRGAEAIGSKREMGRMTNIQKFRVKYGLVPQVKLSHLVPSPVNAIIQKIGGGTAKVQPSAEWQEKIESAYRKSNQIVADRFGLEMAKYGYPV
jgi:hypothetical protein